MDDQILWDLTREAWVSLETRYEPAVKRIVDRIGLDGRGWGLLLAALTFEPESTTPAHLMVRLPYTAAEMYLTRLKTCAEQGFLEEISAGEFRLSARGRLALDQFIGEARTAMATVDPLPEIDSNKLASYLGEIVQSCLKKLPPPDNWSVALSYKLMPAIKPPMPYVEQAISCVAAYRDDSHLAAWQKTGVSATALEVLTLLWREQANSFNKLMEKLAYRGHSEEIYANALTELRKRGYLTGSRSVLRVSAQGKSFRENVEDDTNRFFYAPWSCLNQFEKDEMGRLIINLRDGLRV